VHTAVMAENIVSSDDCFKSSLCLTHSQSVLWVVAVHLLSTVFDRSAFSVAVFLLCRTDQSWLNTTSFLFVQYFV